MGLIVLIGLWWWSHQSYKLIEYRQKQTTISMEIAEGSFHLHRWERGLESFAQPDGFSTSTTSSRPHLGYVLGSNRVSTRGFSASFLVLAILFAAVQFLALPKSIPGSN